MDQTDKQSQGVEQAKTYRFVALCKECGVFDERIVSLKEAKEDGPLKDDPALRHHERTDHFTVLLNYTIAPGGIQKMVDVGGEAIDFGRIAEWLKSDGDGSDE